jgi:hypothetical protein
MDNVQSIDNYNVFLYMAGLLEWDSHVFYVYGVEEHYIIPTARFRSLIHAFVGEAFAEFTLNCTVTI